MPEIAALSPSNGIEFSLRPEIDERGRKSGSEGMDFGKLVTDQARSNRADLRGSSMARPVASNEERPIAKSPEKPKPSAEAKMEESRAPEPEKPAGSASNQPQEGAPSAETLAQAAKSEALDTMKTERETPEGSDPAAVLAETKFEIAASPKELSDAALEAATPDHVAAPIAAVEAPLPVTAPAEPGEGLLAGVQAAGQPANPVPPGATESTARMGMVALAIPGTPGSTMPQAGLSEAPSSEIEQAGGLEAAPAKPQDGATITRPFDAKPMTGSAKASEAPKAPFSDWINDFAFSQGVQHRSGDLVGSLDRAIQALPTPQAGQDALRPTPLQMLPIEIGMQALRGVTKFQIRLDPAELGRVDVQLEFKQDGEVKANLVVERVETLAMLKRDAPTLQQAFEQAGLRQPPDGLQFSLRGESQQRDGQRSDRTPAPEWSPEDEKRMGDLPPEAVMRRVMIPNSSLDRMV